MKAVCPTVRQDRAVVESEAQVVRAVELGALEELDYVLQLGLRLVLPHSEELLVVVIGSAAPTVSESNRRVSPAKGLVRFEYPSWLVMIAGQTMNWTLTMAEGVTLTGMVERQSVVLI